MLFDHKVKYYLVLDVDNIRRIHYLSLGHDKVALGTSASRESGVPCLSATHTHPMGLLEVRKKFPEGWGGGFKLKHLAWKGHGYF